MKNSAMWREKEHFMQRAQQTSGPQVKTWDVLGLHVTVDDEGEGELRKEERWV